jgi:predicted O-methyltransferase YrrM
MNGEDAFGEQWFGPASCQALMRLGKKVKDLDGRIVEVGCWTGRSTCALAQAVYPEDVHAVDTWAGSPGEISAELAQQRNVYEQFVSNVGQFTRGNVEVHRQGWREYFAASEAPIKLLHIDACHTYDEVFDNITAALPLMVIGGILCGDDAHHPPVISAVADTLGMVELQATLWTKVV